MILYFWLKSMVRFAVMIYYRRRVYEGFENVPATGPAIIACNHPNSFLDAMIIGAYLTRNTYFLARSDVFNTPFKLWILSQFKMMPIYRLSEGKEDLGKNQDTFDKCHELFRRGEVVLMFSEGICVQEMRLRPLKKGTARIAMEYSKDGSPLTIIPTGLNYMKPTDFREDLLISMDTSFNAADYAAEYNENPAKGISSFNSRLKEGLQNSVIDIRDKKNEKAIEQLVEIEYNNGADLKKLVSMVNVPFSEEQLAQLSDYRSTLEKNNLRDEAVAEKKSNVLLAIPATIVFGLAFWLYLIPIAPAMSIVKKKIKLAEFKDSVLIGGAVIFTFLYWLILFFTVGSLVSYQIATALILFLILIALLAGPSYDVMRSARNATLAKNQPEIAKQRSILHFVEPHHSHHPVG